MEKFPTGIAGFDEITTGGLPQSRTTLFAGNAGCGKTLFMLTAIVRGAAERGEPAVFLSFEETPRDIIENAAASGLDLQPLIENGTLHIDFVKQPKEAVAEAGQYSLDGLLMRIEIALGKHDAKFIAIDTVEALFAMFENTRIVRRELVRVFDWLKNLGITTLISGERGDERLTRHGFEEYIADCVVLLDQRTEADVTTRRLQIVKYRGSEHGNNAYPFLIDSDGITVMPLTSAQLRHKASLSQVTSGIDRLDDALSGGYRQGSTVLITGSSGTGKSILAASFVAAACRRGEQAILLSFEESPDEIFTNVESVGIDLRKEQKAGRLVLQSTRPTLQGLEQHLVEVYRLVERVEPQVVVIDPLSGLKAAGSPAEVYRTVIRLADYIKGKGITALFTSEESGLGSERGDAGISSIIDTWLSLERARETDQFHRRLAVIKKRGTAHEHGFLRFDIGPDGISFESKTDG